MLFYLFAVLFFFVNHQNSRRISQSLSDYVVNYFLLLVLSIIPTGYVLSELSAINKPLFWGVGVLLVSGVTFFLLRFFLPKNEFALKKNYSANGVKTFVSSLSFSEKVTFVILLIGFLICSLLNSYAFIYAYPNEWDSMTGHLAKCAYYLQNGSMDRIQGTTWSIDFYPNALPTLQLFFYHLFGEMGFKFIHFLSYWIVLAGTYKISLQICQNKKIAIFVLLVTSLLPTALVQATTTETDIVFSAYLCVLIVYLLKFLRKPSTFYLSFIGLIAAVWISHKVTFLLAAPSVAVLVLYIIWKQSVFFNVRNTGIALLVFALGFSVYVLPAGYVGNVKEVGELKIGSLSAPKLVMNWHGIEHLSTKEKLTNFKLNLLRYTSDFIQLDGIRNAPAGEKINQTFRVPFDAFFSQFNIDRDAFWAVNPFRFQHADGDARFYRERPYWGWIGIGLVFPALIMFGASFFRKKKFKEIDSNLALVFFVCGVVHFLSLSFSAVYDPIKARYFMNMSVWFLPLMAYLYKERVKYYLAASAVIIVISAIMTLMFRDLVPLTGERSIGNLSRIEQLLLARPNLALAYKKYNELVPKNAVVALGTQQENEDFEYPLWGESFERKLIPLHPFRQAVKPIPTEAEYLFFSEGVFEVKPGDIRLSEGRETDGVKMGESTFYLRKLK